MSLVSFSGWVSRIESRVTGSGKEMSTFSVTEYSREYNSKEKTYEKTKTYFSVRAHGPLHNFVKAAIRDGSFVFITGHMKLREQNGKYYINVDAVHIVPGPGEDSKQQMREHTRKNSPSTKELESDTGVEAGDDVPW